MRGAISSIAIDFVYPAVLLAHDQSLRLLPAMICSLQNGLRELHTKFYKVQTVINDKGEVSYKTSNPRVELPYTYLMAWFVLHCPNLMTASSSKDSAHLPYVERYENSPYVERYENSDWTSYYMSVIHYFFGVIRTIKFIIVSLSSLMVIVVTVFKISENWMALQQYPRVVFGG